MPEPAAAAARTGPGPSPPAAVPHGLRARAFGLLPEERAAEWAAHVAGVSAPACGPRMRWRSSWRPRSPPRPGRRSAPTAAWSRPWPRSRPWRPGRSHGSDFAERHHAAAMGTAVRFMAAAGMATQRAQRMFLAHRKAVRDGLLAPSRRRWRCPRRRQPEPRPRATTRPNPTRGIRRCRKRHVRTRRTHPRPAHRCRRGRGRRRRRRLGRCPARGRGRSRARGPAQGGAPADRAQGADPRHRPRALARSRAISGGRRSRRLRGVVRPPAQATAHPGQKPGPRGRGPGRLGHPPQPALAQGRVLSYRRPPVPAHLFLPGATDDTPPPVRPAALAAPPAALPPPPADPLPALRARLDRLLDRGQQRLPEELDLAEAVCAVKWPNWPAYRGPVDLGLLRLVLAERTSRPRPCTGSTATRSQGVPGGRLKAPVAGRPRAFPCPAKPPI